MRVSEFVQYVAFGSLAALPWVALFGIPSITIVYAAVWWLLVGVWCAAWARNINRDNE